MKMNGKVAIVTGGVRGIGAAASKVLGQRGDPDNDPTRIRENRLRSAGLKKIPASYMIAHGTAKGTLDTFAKYIAHEFGPMGITANVVAPGAVETVHSSICQRKPNVPSAALLHSAESDSPLTSWV